MATGGKKTTWTFGDAGQAEIIRPKLKAWWIKKPPTAAARSKKRWVEVYLDEIKYFSKTDGNYGLLEKQKGCIGLFQTTKVSASGNVLTIVNPDRTWVLEVAKSKSSGEKSADADKWAKKIGKLAAVSTNKGYLDVEKKPATATTLDSGADGEHWEAKQARLNAAEPAAPAPAAAGGGDGDSEPAAQPKKGGGY
eukprot:gene3497-1775_t